MASLNQRVPSYLKAIAPYQPGKPIADIVPVVADLPSWKRRKAQPLVLDGVSVSRMILEERASGI